MIKRISIGLFFALLFCASARSQDFVQSYALVQAKPAGPGTGTSFANTGVTSFAIFWTPATTVSSCSVQVDSSVDGISWGSGDLIGPQNCTVLGSAPAATITPGTIYVRVNVTALTGNGGVNVTIKGWGGAGGTSGAVGPGTPNSVSCFNTTTNVGNCPGGATDSGTVFTIPETVVMGAGTSAASVSYPSGNSLTCLTPATGFNDICSDSILNTITESDNGSSYLPLAKVTGTPTGGNCASYSSVFVLQDSGQPCNNFPSSGPAHTWTGNPTESTGSLLTPSKIGDNDVFPNVWCTTTGSADAYVATLPVAATALTAGVVLHMTPNFTNTTTTPTVNLSTLGGKNILKNHDGVLVNVVPGDIAINVEAVLHYDGTQFELLNPATTRSMWPCAPQSGLSDTVDNTTSPTETLFTTVCKIPANTLVTGMVIDGLVGLDWTATATVPNSTFKMYICPTQASLTGCKNVYTGTTSPASAGTFSATLPFVLFGRQAAGATAAVTQASGAGVGANTPFGRNSIAGNLTNVPTNADLYIQFSMAIAANTAGNSYTIRSLFFR